MIPAPRSHQSSCAAFTNHEWMKKIRLCFCFCLPLYTIDERETGMSRFPPVLLRTHARSVVSIKEEEISSIIRRLFLSCFAFVLFKIRPLALSLHDLLLYKRYAVRFFVSVIIRDSLQQQLLFSLFFLLKFETNKMNRLEYCVILFSWPTRTLFRLSLSLSGQLIEEVLLPSTCPVQTLCPIVYSTRTKRWE